MPQVYDTLNWQSATLDNVAIEKTEGVVTAVREVHTIGDGFKLMRESIKTSAPLHYLPLENSDYIGMCFMFSEAQLTTKELAYDMLYHDNLNITNGYHFGEKTLQPIHKPLHYVSLQFDNKFLDDLQLKQTLPTWLSKLITYRDDQILEQVSVPLAMRQLAWQACIRPQTQQLSDALYMQAKGLEWLATTLNLDNRYRPIDAHTNIQDRPSVFSEFNQATQLAANACEIIHQQYSQPLTIQTIAKQVGTNDCYLKKYFKAHTGQSIHDYLTQHRLSQAKNLLTYYPKLNIQEIAQLCGYQAAHFSQLFKAINGLSPSHYRQQYLPTQHSSK